MTGKEKPAEKTYRVEVWCGGVRVTDIALDLAYYGIRTERGTSWFMLPEGNSPFDEDVIMPTESAKQLSIIAGNQFLEKKDRPSTPDPMD